MPGFLEVVGGGLAVIGAAVGVVILFGAPANGQALGCALGVMAIGWLIARIGQRWEDRRRW